MHPVRWTKNRSVYSYWHFYTRSFSYKQFTFLRIWASVSGQLNHHPSPPSLLHRSRARRASVATLAVAATLSSRADVRRPRHPDGRWRRSLPKVAAAVAVSHVDGTWTRSSFARRPFLADFSAKIDRKFSLSARACCIHARVYTAANVTCQREAVRLAFPFENAKIVLVQQRVCFRFTIYFRQISIPPRIPGVRYHVPTPESRRRRRAFIPVATVTAAARTTCTKNVFTPSVVVVDFLFTVNDATSGSRSRLTYIRDFAITILFRE